MKIRRCSGFDEHLRKINFLCVFRENLVIFGYFWSNFSKNIQKRLIFIWKNYYRSSHFKSVISLGLILVHLFVNSYSIFRVSLFCFVSSSLLRYLFVSSLSCSSLILFLPTKFAPLFFVFINYLIWRLALVHVLLLNFSYLVYFHVVFHQVFLVDILFISLMFHLSVIFTLSFIITFPYDILCIFPT